ncbi:MAG: hypothetical protein U0K92_10490 [Treponema sp.]|nr:hypothetical protein [Treponema sp.]
MSKLVAPLYHGTDRKVLSMSYEERTSAKNSAFALINYYYNVFIQNGFEFKDYRITSKPEYDKHKQELREKLRIFERETWDAYTVACLLNKPDYQYESFYLTGDYDKACRYAKRAAYFGEIGSVAYRLWHGATLLNYTSELNTIESDLQKLQSIWELPNKPVLIKFPDLEKNQLLNERGEELFNSNLPDSLYTKLSFRLKETPNDLSDYEIIELDKKDIS